MSLTSSYTHVIRRYSLLLFSLYLLTSCAFLPTNERPYQLHNNTLIIKTSDGNIKYTALAGDAIEVLYKSETTQLPSFAKAASMAVISPKVNSTKESITLINGSLKAVVNRTNFTTSFYSNNKLLTTQQAYFDTPKKRGFSFTLDDTEMLMGGGERVLGMNRRGHRMPLYNKAHYGYTTESNQMNFGLPMVMSNKKYTVLFDNSASGFLDIGKTEKNTLSFEAVGGRSAYIVFAGDSYPKLINNYVDVTGKQPLPPRWAFGNFASRFGYKSEQQVRDVVDKFITDDFPLDAVILDLYWFGADMKGNMGNLAWDKTHFPTPQKMMADLNNKGIKTILISEPFVVDTSKRWDDAVKQDVLAKNTEGQPYDYDFYFGHTGLIDVFNDNSQRWLADIYDDLFNQGVTGTWGDLGEPEVHPDDMLHFISETQQVARGDEIHNAFGHQWAKLVYENQRDLQPNTRPFIIMRSGFAGSQRFGMIPWTGDVSRSWGGLKPQVELTLQMGMMGMAYTHSDLGGFAGGETFDKEMYIRWLQYGAFQPIFRPHAQDAIAPEPIFHDEETKDITREFVKLRYRLLPYLYTMAYQNSTTGLPLMRPLFFDDENNNALFENKDTYLWGDAFLVSPITDPELTEQSVTLPKGVWFDYWNDTRYNGDSNVTVSIALETIPVLVRAGAFIPMVETINNTNEYSSKTLNLHYYADQSITQSEGHMYEDDGESFGAIERGEYDLLNFLSQQNEHNLTFIFDRQGTGYKDMPNSRDINFVIHHWKNAPSQISIDGTTLSNTAYKFDKENQQLSISFEWINKQSNIVITK